MGLIAYAHDEWWAWWPMCMMDNDFENWGILLYERQTLVVVESLLWLKTKLIGNLSHDYWNKLWGKVSLKIISSISSIIKYYIKFFCTAPRWFGKNKCKNKCKCIFGELKKGDFFTPSLPYGPMSPSQQFFFGRHP